MLQRLVARGLDESPRARALMVELQGRRIALEIVGTPWTCTLGSTGLTLAFETAATGAVAADARITGTPLALLQLAGAQGQHVIQRGAVRIDGDAQVAERFRELLRHLRPELEASLAPLLGRSAAHLLVRALGEARQWTRASAWTGVRNVAEFLAHERRTLVPLAEAEHFLRGVEDAREQLDRAEARTLDLERRLRRLAGAPGPA